MRVRPVLVSLCLCFSLTAMEAGGSGTQINIPNINPGVERRLELLRQKEANDRMQRENSQDTLQMVSLAAELKQYAAASDGSGLPPEALKKASQLEKLAKRVRNRLNNRMLGIGAH
jgi:hypothetical protein